MWLEIVITLVCLLPAILLGYSIRLLILKTLTILEAVMCNCKTRLEGKTVLVTGGNSGIGFETAKNLAQRGARVIIADVMNAEKSVEEIIRFTGNSKVEYRYLNLANFKSVKAFAEDINITIDHLDILVNNAGCLMDNKVSEDGINMIMQVNYLGPYLLTKLILPKLIPTQSRIVNVSSGMYFCGELDLQDLAGLKPKNFFKSYINSKLCTVLWTKALAKTLPTNVSVFCLHPGMVATNIVGFIKGPIGSFLKKCATVIVKNPYEGAQTSIHLCVAPNIEVLSGSYFSNCKVATTTKIINDTNIDDLWNETDLFLNEKINGIH
ncbi:retinol dehydrogenase 11-like [Pieris brassicae]|uniref:retinol dehydrogenase 11-like n=1 Tax=Pieris brassicae TaxID=7116 RepID=UPI001E661AEC|nr:retinol dehydrogenase 11-like [Pieris brassicae]